jgi:hypothetical protein
MSRLVEDLWRKKLRKMNKVESTLSKVYQLTTKKGEVW